MTTISASKSQLERSCCVWCCSIKELPPLGANRKIIYHRGTEFAESGVFLVKNSLLRVLCVSAGETFEFLFTMETQRIRGYGTRTCFIRAMKAGSILNSP